MTTTSPTPKRPRRTPADIAASLEAKAATIRRNLQTGAIKSAQTHIDILLEVADEMKSCGLTEHAKLVQGTIEVLDEALAALTPRDPAQEGGS